jgi:hypothetical protein
MMDYEATQAKLIQTQNRLIDVLEIQERLEAFLLDLVPGGSEFHDNPARCAEWIRERLATTGKIARERNELRAAAETLAEALEKVEYITYTGSGGQTCPWCHAFYPRHRKSCIRAKALDMWKSLNTDQ